MRSSLCDYSDAYILVKRTIKVPNTRTASPNNYYNYFKNYIKMIAIDLSKEQVLDADPKAILQIYFTGNLD